VASRSEGAPRTVLVTGASGFTGRYMVQALESRNYSVISLASAVGLPDGAPQSQAGVAHVKRADLRDLRALTRVMDEVRPDHVIHLAALAYVAHGQVDDFYQVNLMGTRNLLQAMQDAGHQPSSVLLASSANVYGNAYEGEISESFAPRPANDYAVSKLAMEHVAGLWSEKLPLIIARPFNYTGVGQEEKYLIPKIVSHFLRRDTEIELGNIDVWRDFGDVRAVVDAYAQLIALPLASFTTVNVCSGHSHSLREVVDLCRQITGQDISIKINPAFVRSNEVRVLRGSNDRLRHLIGDWESPPIQQTLEWMLRTQ